MGRHGEATPNVHSRMASFMTGGRVPSPGHSIYIIALERDRESQFGLAKRRNDFVCTVSSDIHVIARVAAGLPITTFALAAKLSTSSAVRPRLSAHLAPCLVGPRTSLPTA